MTRSVQSTIAGFVALSLVAHVRSQDDRDADPGAPDPGSPVAVKTNHAEPVANEAAAPYEDAAAPGWSAKEAQALALARRWMQAKDAPVLGENGQLRFLFGATLPVIVCAPLRGTDVALEPGEIVKPEGVHIGDSVRWQVMPAVSGPAGKETTHLIIKPTDSGLSTNLVIGTDRRTYHLALVSSRGDWMPCVGFNYPAVPESEWESYHAMAEAARANSSAHGAGDGAQSLDFNYEIEGDAPWKPLRVYSDGTRTVIQMPARMKSTEAPAFLVLGDGDREQVVNYRLLGDRYIVDQVFDRAVLVLGVGRKQARVTITRTR